MSGSKFKLSDNWRMCMESLNYKFELYGLIITIVDDIIW